MLFFFKRMPQNIMLGAIRGTVEHKMFGFYLTKLTQQVNIQSILHTNMLNKAFNQ